VSGGISISAYTGVASVTAQALGAHSSASGTGSGVTTADPGSISVNAGAHVYTATLANALVGRDAPTDFRDFGTGSDASIKGDAAYAIVTSAGTSDPQWTWYFDSPSTWLANVVALNPAPPPEPIALDQANGTFGESGTVLIKGFNPRTPTSAMQSSPRSTG